MRQIFQVWYDHEAEYVAGKKTPAKQTEPYKVAKPGPIYHLELQHAVEEAGHQDDELAESVRELAVEETPKNTAPPPNLPAPPKQNFADNSVKLIEPLKILWLYLDPSGNEQGPFSGETMQDWLTEGYLSFDLQIRRNTDAAFQTLNDFCGKVRNITHPFLVPLPETEDALSSASPQGNIGAPFETPTLSNINLLTENGNGLGSTGFQQSNGSQSAFNAPLYSQLMPNGSLGSNNMRISSNSHLFDFMGNNDYLMNQQQFPPSQFGIDPSLGQNIGNNIGPNIGQNIGQNIGNNIGQNISGGFGQLNMSLLLHNQMPSQPLMSRTNSGWGVDSNLTGNGNGVSSNPLGMPQPSPISPWLSGVQSISRVSSPFAPPTALSKENKSEDHVLQDFHSLMVTGILNEDDHKQEYVSGPAVEETKLEVEEKQSEPEEEEKVVAEPAQPVQPAEVAEPVEMVEPVKVAKTEEAAKPSLAPWAVPKTTSTSVQPELTLKQIQQLEAEKLEKDRQLRAELRQEQAQAQALAELAAQKQEEKQPETVTFNWAKVSQPAVAQKTLAEIQKEEADARAKALKANAASAAAAKPSLASSLASAVPREEFSAWTTVASKKAMPKKTGAPIISSPANASLSPHMLRAASSNIVIGSTVNSNAAKEDFLVWARSQMTNLYPSVSKNDLLEIFTTLPVHGDSAQLISETIYSSSATMDGRRFAQEFLTKRQAVEKKLGPGDNGSWSAAIAASADKVLAVDDDGWSTSVKSKKKGKKN